MNATLSPRAAVLTLMAIATVFGANHIAARIAFDDGASVTTAVFARAAVTALALLALMRLAGVRMSLSRHTFVRGSFVGLLVCLQSFCIFSAVARIPVALALLAFNAFPVILALLEWVLDGQRPGNRTMAAMFIALVGLGFALDLVGARLDLAGRWQDIGVGVLFGLGAALSYAVALYLTLKWMRDVDGRMRTFLTVSVTAVLMLMVGAAGGSFAFPAGTTGWFCLALMSLLYGAALTTVFTVQPLPGVSRYTAALNFEPIALLFMGWAILGQSVKPLQVFGAFVVMGAVVLLSSKK